ncbi:conserved hypothetical protein, partial [Ixodes scapularis]
AQARVGCMNGESVCVCIFAVFTISFCSLCLCVCLVACLFVCLFIFYYNLCVCVCVSVRACARGGGG